MINLIILGLLAVVSILLVLSSMGIVRAKNDRLEDRIEANSPLDLARDDLARTSSFNDTAKQLYNGRAIPDEKVLDLTKESAPETRSTLIELNTLNHRAYNTGSTDPSIEKKYTQLGFIKVPSFSQSRELFSEQNKTIETVAGVGPQVQAEGKSMYVGVEINPDIVVIRERNHMHHFIHTSLGPSGYHIAVKTDIPRDPNSYSRVKAILGSEVADKYESYLGKLCLDILPNKAIIFLDYNGQFDKEKLIESNYGVGEKRPTAAYIHIIVVDKEFADSLGTNAYERLKNLVEKDYLGATGVQKMGKAIEVVHSELRRNMQNKEYHSPILEKFFSNLIDD
jgi:hypothetical protein